MNVSATWVPASCMTVGGSRDPGPVLHCMQAAGYRQFMTFQPAMRYWPFQPPMPGAPVPQRMPGARPAAAAAG